MSGLPRKTRHRRQAAGRLNVDTLKPKHLCQCMDTRTKQGCEQIALQGSLYCETHQSCPLGATNGFETNYCPGCYNDDPSIYKSHNCYSYAMGVIDTNLVEKCRRHSKKNTCRKSFHQPGALNGDRYTLNAQDRRTCPVVEKLMLSDVPEITKTSFSQSCPRNTSKIALVVDPGEDYHFYKQDSDGFWSHKDGSNKVKRYDALKRPIANPQFASRNYRWQNSDLNYEDFCGFYCVPRREEVRLGQGGAMAKARVRGRSYRKRQG